MRVLQLGPYPPPHGGVQSNLVAIRRYLLNRNVPCAVINITRHRKPDADEVYYPKTSLDLLRLLFWLDYDIVHLHLGGMLTNRLLGLGLACCLMPRSKAVLTFHSGGYPSSPEGERTSAASLTGFVFRRFDKVIGVNPAIMEFFQKVGVPEERRCLIYPHSFPEDSLGQGTPREPLPEVIASFLDSHSPVLVSVGLLEKEYDLPLQIAVMDRTRQKFRNAGLLMIGSGSLEGELRALVKTQPYAEHLMLCGDVSHPATLQAILRCDAMLRTTHFDGDAVSVREALYLGVPVIASDNGMRPGGVRLIPSRNLDALFDAICETLATVSERPQRVVRADETNIEAVFNVYQELLGGRRPARS